MENVYGFRSCKNNLEGMSHTANGGALSVVTHISEPGMSWSIQIKRFGKMFQWGFNHALTLFKAWFSSLLIAGQAFCPGRDS